MFTILLTVLAVIDIVFLVAVALRPAEFRVESLTAADDAEAERLFASLADGGQVQMPIGKTFFSSRFGMVADRFGVPWMIVVAP